MGRVGEGSRMSVSTSEHLRGCWARCAAIAAAVLLPWGSASAQTDFYTGRSIEFIVGYNAGDTYDAYARLAARHINKHIPGAPTIVVRNMQGVGGIRAANYLYAQAPQDGSAIGMFGQNLALDQLLATPAVQYDVRKFAWIGRMVPVLQFVVAWHTSPVKTIEDARTHEIVIAATSKAGATSTIPRLLNRFAHTKFKIVHGYPQLSALMLAMERGETAAASASAQMLLLSRPELLAKPLISVLVQYTKERSKLFPNVPALGEFGDTPDDKKILQIYGTTTDLGRSITAAPRIPLDRLAVLRAAFDQMRQDKAFLDDAKTIGLEIDALPGDKVLKIVEETLDVTPELAKALEQALNE